ncbi:MAG TPA: hypothetical protein VM866_08160 [Pyrinomonadaceae bacterium]|nr:hypothetical protein [Pyrinomonadaceae bacterium]
MRLRTLVCILLVIGCAGVNAIAGRRAIRYEDIAASLHAVLNRQGVDRDNFDAYITSLNRRTIERETIGENDHLIFFILQSERFTRRARIEPALSAAGFMRHLSAGEKARYLKEPSFIPPTERLPTTVAERFNDFIKATKEPGTDERLKYFRHFITREKPPADSSFPYLYRQYARAMRFLYEKEFVSREIADSQSLAARVAPLYQDRGHSTDTQVEANFAVHTALAVIKFQTPQARLNNVLIVGPGLDFAPRTDLIDLFEPQSYQPFAVADALLSLKLADPERLRVHCVDINERVVSHLGSAAKSKQLQLSILTGVADTDARSLSAEYKDYFRQLGRGVGTESQLGGLPARYKRHLSKSLLVRPEVAAAVSAEKLNIVTERLDPSPQYDLVVVTNVFPYFNPTELLLALANIEAMMGKGGYLIHNEARPELFALAARQGLPVVGSRTMLIASGAGVAPLYDGVWTHRKSVGSRKSGVRNHFGFYFLPQTFDVSCQACVGEAVVRI